ncbi:phosphoenolpyruvate--protein phosphotransferase [Bacteroidota bacterium]
MLKDVEINRNMKNQESIPQKVLKGIPSSPGLAHGQAVVIQPEKISLLTERIPDEQIPNELVRLETAVNDLVQEFVSALSKVKEESKNVAAVLESDLMILTDEAFLGTIRERIKKGFSTENAIIQEFDTQIHLLKKANDHILRQRVIELENIKERLIAVLRNRCIDYSNGKNAVIVARSLTPTDIVNFKEEGVLAFVTEIGGISSHSSILARSFNIPEVIGIKEATSIIQDDVNLIVDGYTGTVTVHPNNKSISLYESKKLKEQEHTKQLGDLIKLNSVTSDGKTIHLLANIDIPDDVANTIMYGAEGIGLVRSEQLIISKNYIPTEEEQFIWYKSIADPAYPNSVTIRAFDIGSDKFSEGMPKHENNPALGFRGIRYLLHRKDIFRTQIRAILRVSKNKNIRLMLPMITCFSEVEESLRIIEECKNELQQEKVPFDNTLPVGVMIETPAAAILAEKISTYVSFFSIGTNDLTQYTLAVDRTNEFVSSIYDSFHPSVLSLIKMTADAATKHKIPVSICGELAGHAAATALLIGMGITELSVSPPILLELKKRIREIKFTDAKKLAKDVLKIADCENIRKKLSIDTD